MCLPMISRLFGQLSLTIGSQLLKYRLSRNRTSEGSDVKINQTFKGRKVLSPKESIDEYVELSSQWDGQRDPQRSSNSKRSANIMQQGSDVEFSAV